MMSYNGQLDFGLLADYDAMPDLDRVADFLEDAVDELLDAVRRAAPTATERPAARRSDGAGAKRRAAGRGATRGPKAGTPRTKAASTTASERDPGSSGSDGNES
jgi:hypothetical protein